jgi:histidyl-tRNA synthetase
MTSLYRTQTPQKNRPRRPRQTQLDLLGSVDVDPVVDQHLAPIQFTIECWDDIGFAMPSIATGHESI